jgi:large subunit ribosomal protein L22
VAAETETQGVRAQAKYVRASARKARLVVEHIRGRTVPEARTVLAFTQRAVSRDIEKVLRSAVANAEANHGLVGDQLVVGSATVDEGPTVKRWRPRARGRVNRIFKRTCHITLVLVPGEQALETAAPSGRRRGAQAAPAVETPAAEEKPKRARKPKAEAVPAVPDTAVEEAPPAEAAPEEVELVDPDQATVALPQEPETSVEETVAEDEPAELQTPQAAAEDTTASKGDTA